MARALVEVTLAGAGEKIALALRSGETAELVIVNKDPQHVMCEVAVNHLSGVLSSLIAVELGDKRLYLGKSSKAGESISAEIEPGGTRILRVRFIAPPNRSDYVQLGLEVRLHLSITTTTKEKASQGAQAAPKLLPTLVHEKT
uniref:Uncharacterized protein n=1 Tax=Thermofilum pendens TaxID=2269 RepID=A0A7C1P612_THEPE